MSRDSRREHCREHEFRFKNFPENIKDLLCLLANNEDNRVTIVLDVCEDCVQENIEIVAVVGHLAVFRCHDKFKFVDIDCICEVIVDCNVILEEILESSSGCRC